MKTAAGKMLKCSKAVCSFVFICEIMPELVFDEFKWLLIF